MSLDEMNDIYDARANLEAMIIALAIERGDDAWERQCWPTRIPWPRWWK